MIHEIAAGGGRAKDRRVGYGGALVTEHAAIQHACKANRQIELGIRDVLRFSDGPGQGHGKRKGDRVGAPATARRDG